MSVVWNLSKDLYYNQDDPQIFEDKALVREKAIAFSNRYRGKVKSLSGKKLSQAIEDYKEISLLTNRLGSFAYLNWVTDTQDFKLSSFLKQMQRFLNDIGQNLIFFDVEFLKLKDKKANKLINSPYLFDHKFWLTLSRKEKDHVLTEPEEKIVAEKGMTGAGAWVQFFTKLHSKKIFTFQKKKITAQELMNKLQDPEDKTRKDAAKLYTDFLKSQIDINTYIYNNLILDKYNSDKRRGYKNWYDSRHLSNLIDKEVVDSLLDRVTANYCIVSKYYNLKAKILLKKQLKYYDRLAPLSSQVKAYTWAEARRIVYNSYLSFSKKSANIVDDFFLEEWIHARIIPGKKGGAFCYTCNSAKHPYVFMNFEGTENDVMTLAHELGHGMHGVLARKQGMFMAHAPLVLAETASTFGEILTFNYLYDKEEDKRRKLALLMSKVEDMFATIFRQTSMYLFEDLVQEHYRREGELSNDQFNKYWIKTQKDMYGDSIDLMEDEYKYWWSYIPHFIHTPGYVYAYSFGELLVLALYEMYERSNKNSFIEKYFNLLSAGGSNYPQELLKEFEIDLKNPNFWQKGINIINKTIEKAEDLYEEIVEESK
jgi:oligoendopeptidase F